MIKIMYVIGVSMFRSLALLFSIAAICALPESQEPVCVSRFDYEHKMLHSIVKLEIGQEKQQESIEKLYLELGKENKALKEEIQQLRDTVAGHELAIKTTAVGNQELHKNLTTHCAQQCRPGDGMESEGYTFKDYLAQATCTALGVRYVNAVRRTCSSSSPNCASICSSLGKTCVNSLHVYERAKISTSDVGKLGLQLYRYNSCSIKICGPNFCCCQQ